jgi:hypothetical protein
MLTIGGPIVSRGDPDERAHPGVNCAPQWRRSPMEAGSIQKLSSINELMMAWYRFLHQNVIGNGLDRKGRVRCVTTSRYMPPLFEICHFPRLSGKART